jgi:hypothetical protein
MLGVWGKSEKWKASNLKLGIDYTGELKQGFSAEKIMAVRIRL